MNQILINLLPVELRANNTESKKKSLLVRLSIGWLLIMVVATVGLLSFRFIQNNQIQNLNGQVNEAKQKVNTFKPQEELVLVLKQRIKGISEIISQESAPSQAFNIITSLTPAQVRIVSFSTDRSGNIVMEGQADNLNTLKELFDNLTDPKRNEGRIASSRVESLSQGASDQVRFNLTIVLNKGKS